ncbi:DUF74-domain-containing protein [Cryphonectria parasitica EP155]|uniref:DUF74-domain-containing protein n=1 Tax=Cryphonectria parasitica (strain ATCC 38755 / EP155) TaxID=660469 RepID=A0A9P5CQ67_CRYP1|nr:DUF74-domain-containing protein [Cryphonectria parasitica EP155]KAF3765710.1 DUF74-domain-containing protein [Cryphonectria parasitica EP155]
MFDVPGYRIVRVLGTVYGMTVRTRNWAAGFGMGLKSMVGGELKWLTNMMYSARNEAVSRVCDEGRKRGANAVIAMRFDIADLPPRYTQVCCYGTAVLLEKVDPDATDVPQLKSTAP